MLEGRRREAWDHTATLLAAAHNLFRPAKRPARHPWDFHPYRRDEARSAAGKITVAELARFCGVR